jgi:hypothetical protein
MAPRFASLVSLAPATQSTNTKHMGSYGVHKPERLTAGLGRAYRLREAYRFAAGLNNYSIWAWVAAGEGAVRAGQPHPTNWIHPIDDAILRTGFIH